MNLKTKTERHFTDRVPEKQTDGKRHGYLKAEKWAQILLDSDCISANKQMQSLLHSNITCHSNAKHSPR